MAVVPVRVLVADNQEFLASEKVAALGSLGEFELVGVAASPLEAGGLAALTRPDVAVVNVRLAGGAEVALDEILSASPDTRVLAYSGVTDPEAVTGMMRAGASGYGVPEAATVERFDDAGGHGLVHELLDQVRETNNAREERAPKRARIRSVMDNGGLEIVFQPIVELESRTVVGHEALSRFRASPMRGPAQWFAEAHEVGLGTQLELWAVKLACERSRLLPKSELQLRELSRLGVTYGQGYHLGRPQAAPLRA